ncbi:MAG: radical SAM protein [Limnohabitans sp.]
MKLLWHGDIVRRIIAGEDTYPVMIELSLTMACDLRCVWCVDLPWREARPGTLKADVLLRRLEEFRKLGTAAITIEGGGEPTLHTQFAEIVRGASDMGYALGLISHGGHLEKHEAVLDRFQWILVVECTADAGDEMTLAQFSKRLKSWSRFERGLEKSAVGRYGFSRSVLRGILLREGWVDVCDAEEPRFVREKA